MSDLEFRDDHGTKISHASSVSLRRTPFMVKLLIDLKLAKDEKTANWLLVCIAVIFFLASGGIFLMATGFNFNSLISPSGNMEIETPSSNNLVPEI